MIHMSTPARQIIPPELSVANHRRELGLCPWCKLPLVERPGAKCKGAQKAQDQGYVHSTCVRCGWCDCWDLTDRIDLRQQKAIQETEEFLKAGGKLKDFKPKQR